MFIDPMLLATAPGPFSDPRFIYEPKIDGHRLIFSQQNGVIRLYTRHNNDCTRQYPELQLPFGCDDVVLDGEVACTDPTTGLSDFEAVMARLKAGKTDKINRLTRTQPATYVIFDILRYKGEDLRRLPLKERKEILANLELPSASFGVVPYIAGAGKALFAQIEARGMEGVVGKRMDSKYETGRRSVAWQKVINWSYAEVFIIGYQKKEFGWLTAILDESGKLRPTGIIEHGPGKEIKRDFYAAAKRFISGETQDFVYLEPRIRARVKMRNWTKAGLLRSPVFEKFII
ncbi:ATP-dependent DNA ligase [Paenibacillus macerans]|uniref:ATP dependent DNA ligase domain protein n=1 Tax=Paenibacillus macerans TaxID=44252 RepID=A0A090Y5N6_PAEMA|nr:ATP-dependent DNA ligase [Paenibacillus macerans]KFM93132.1 ATP dependent DNA ligase domain protein [Paenibacillus macerans]MCY7558533.1 ATP-dependent DNA ligase [Paenibacillus macerans]MEC0153959.1 ATP-dependent DNA ligase [Paenibacillus macerans]SUA84767.1 ATP-dependent DNA ligase [Paenibacillus macerans]